MSVVIFLAGMAVGCFIGIVIMAVLISGSSDD